jgi:hypothetical protein
MNSNLAQYNHTNLHFLLVRSWIKSLQIFEFAFLTYHDFLRGISTKHPITQAL